MAGSGFRFLLVVLLVELLMASLPGQLLDTPPGFSGNPAANEANCDLCAQVSTGGKQDGLDHLGMDVDSKKKEGVKGWDMLQRSEMSKSVLNFSQKCLGQGWAENASQPYFSNYSWEIEAFRPILAPPHFLQFFSPSAPRPETRKIKFLENVAVDFDAVVTFI